MFSNLHLSWFFGNVLPATKEGDKLRNTGFVFQVVDQLEGSQTNSVIRRFSVLYYHIRTVTSQSRLWNIQERGVIITRLLI